MFSPLRLAPFIFPLLAAPAWADCPTGADLAKGIVFTTQDGIVEKYTARPNGVVQLDEPAEDGFVYRSLLGQGVHLLQLIDLENGRIIPDSAFTISYPMAASDLPLPEPNAAWTIQTVVNSAGDIYPETQTQTWGAMAPFTVGGCTYASIPIKTRYDSDGFVITEEIRYFPDLKMSLLLGYKDSDGGEERYTYLTVDQAQ